VSFRAKILLTIALSVGLSVALVAFATTRVLTKHFEAREQREIASNLAAFEAALSARQKLQDEALERAAASTEIARLASEVALGTLDPGAGVSVAADLARSVNLPYLDVVGPDRRILSSSANPARFGYGHPLVLESRSPDPVSGLETFEVADRAIPALIAIRAVPAGDRHLYLIGATPFATVLQDTGLPAYARATLAGNAPPKGLEQLVKEAIDSRTSISRTVQTRVQHMNVEEIVTAIPLVSLSEEVLDVVLLTQSKVDSALLRRYINQIAAVIGLIGVATGLLFGWVAATRVALPIRELSYVAQELGAGNFEVAAPESKDEVGRLGAAFNRMRDDLLNSRARLVQSERVAAWRELARRLAHELKNPLFPLQLTIENLQRARTSPHLNPGEFDEIFNESTKTLLDEVQNLKKITQQFGDFAKMPAPELAPVDLNGLAEAEASLLRSQAGSRAVDLNLDLSPGLPPIQADEQQIRRVLRNLILNALDALPQGGRIVVRTSHTKRAIRLEVSDNGVGLTQEEQNRLFTPYYTTKAHGTGLGLAIVQSVVSDHGASISVASEPGKGTVFAIDFAPSAVFVQP
jgi:two-component system, NtrC family, nitrogen regulation sensor histidine kinase NtrY